MTYDKWEYPAGGTYISPSSPLFDPSSRSTDTTCPQARSVAAKHDRSTVGKPISAASSISSLSS